MPRGREVRRRGALVLHAACALAACALGACAPAPRVLEWEFSTDARERLDEVATWETAIVAGGCPAQLDAHDGAAGDDGGDDRDAGDSAAIDGGGHLGAIDSGAIDRDAAIDAVVASPLWHTRFAASDEARDAPPVLPAGTYGLVIVGRDLACRPVLAGCREVDLPRGDGTAVRVALARADGPACAECVAGACRDDAPARYRTCAGPAEIGVGCDDGRDDDCDRAPDCLDNDCAGGPACGCGADADCGSCERCERVGGTCEPGPDAIACDDGLGFCVGGACCAGCVDGGSCEPGTSASACGAGGIACVPCACRALDGCVDGSCSERGTVATVAAGDRHGCAIDAAGALFCWGDGASGRLGTGSLSDRAAPTAVPCPVSGGCRWRAIALGHRHACGILTDSASVVRLACWGDNASGQLGTGSSSTTRPVLVGGGLGTGAHRTLAVDVGDSFTCAVVQLMRTGPGVIHCWGEGDEHRLGTGSTTDRTTPTALALSSDPTLDFSAIALGRAHACARDAEGRLACWGANDHGQLGLGSSVGASLATPRVHSLATWTAIGAGGDHTCGAEIPTASPNARLRCWGANGSGQLGLGHTTDQSVAAVLTTVSSRRGWRIAAGLDHTCVLEDDATASDDAFCFGANTSLEVAEAGADTTFPQRITGNWRSVAAGADHTCVVGSAGALSCRGANDIAQLGRPAGPPVGLARTCL